MCVHIASIHSENLSYLSFHYIQNPNEQEQNNPLKSNITIKDFFFFFLQERKSQGGWEVCLGVGVVLIFG